MTLTMKNVLLPLMTIPLGLSLVGCGSDHLMDNAPVATQVYFAVSQADMNTCGAIEVSGNIIDFSTKPSQEMNWSKESHWFHIDLRQWGYKRTQWKDEEVILGKDSTPPMIVMKRPGAYSYSIPSLFRYNWKLRLYCRNSGRETLFQQISDFKELHRAAVVTLTTKQGTVAVNIKEFRDSTGGATPAQMNLP